MSRLCVIVPGFGYKIIDTRVLRLQPWKYLFQILFKLINQYGNVGLIPVEANLSDDVVRYVRMHGIEVTKDTNLCKHVFVPVSYGFLKKILKLGIKNSGQIYHGILTTPLMDLLELLYNYFIIKISRTSISIDSLLRENIMFRLKGSTLGKILDDIIVPSSDYKHILRERLDFKNRIVVYYPDISCEKTRSKNNGNDTKIITYFGAFSEERGVISLLKAIRKISNNKNTIFQLLIRETGSKNISKYRDLLEQQNDNVKVIVGDISWKELREKIALSDIVILPYRVIPSTVPLAFLEALLMYRGILVLSTLVPGIKEHITEYMFEEYYIRPNFSVKDLTRILTDLVESEDILRDITDRQGKYAVRLCEKIRGQQLDINI